MSTVDTEFASLIENVQFEHPSDFDMERPAVRSPPGIGSVTMRTLHDEPAPIVVINTKQVSDKRQADAPYARIVHKCGHLWVLKLVAGHSSCSIVCSSWNSLGCHGAKQCRGSAETPSSFQICPSLPATLWFIGRCLHIPRSILDVNSCWTCRIF